jgi:hypothetical protein
MENGNRTHPPWALLGSCGEVRQVVLRGVGLSSASRKPTYQTVVQIWATAPTNAGTLLYNQATFSWNAETSCNLHVLLGGFTSLQFPFFRASR